MTSPTIDTQSLSKRQVEMARHALGLPNNRRRSYRNHYVTGEGCDGYELWLAMVESGHARRRNGSQISGGYDIFWLTRKGADAVIAPGERLDPEDFPEIANAD